MRSRFEIYSGTITKYAYITGGNLGLEAEDVTSTPLEWTENTVLSTTFSKDEYGNEVVSGSNFSGELGGVGKYRIYKTIGESNTMYDLGELSADRPRIFYDYTVGNSRDTKYYIFPIYEHDGVEAVKSPIESKTAVCDFGFISILGLNRIDENVYEVDEDNIWNFGLNVTYNGLTLNTDKTFTDALSTFPSSSTGRRNYFTGQQVRGLIGRMDCKSQSYVDSADLIEQWRAFTSNGKLKLFKDTRGIVFPCDIKDVSFEYDNSSTRAIYVSFTPIQLANLQDISVRHTPAEINTSKYKYLADSSGTLLYSTEENGRAKTLIVPTVGGDKHGS